MYKRESIRNLLDEDFYQLEELGEIISYGSSTVVLDPFKENSYNNLLLAITIEKEKLNFLKSLAKIEKSIIVKKLDKKNLTIDNREFIEYLEEEFNLNFFYINRGVVPNLFDTTNCVDFSLRELTQRNLNTYYYMGKDFSKSSSLLLEELEDIFNEDIIENASEEDINEEKKLFSIVLKTLENSFEAISNSKSKSKIYLDLHEDQFLFFGDNLVCLDPCILLE